MSETEKYCIFENSQGKQNAQKTFSFERYFQCASSSLQNIFLRFGEKYSLNFAVPRAGHQLYGKIFLIKRN